MKPFREFIKGVVLGKKKPAKPVVKRDEAYWTTGAGRPNQPAANTSGDMFTGNQTWNNQ
jgi:hypothetical protein